ncbi:MAG: PAS domain S-box protein [Opitutaceae bacterium]|nr:PAS domain S-box protein [Opitutaceae bacterium]
MPWLRGLVDALPGAIYRCRADAVRTVEFVSAGCREVFGVGPDALVGLEQGGLARRMYPEDAILAGRIVQEALAAREPFEISYRVRRADGSVAWLMDRGRGVFAADGTVAAVEGMISDVTRLRHAEAQLAERERVSGAIFERTSLLVGLLDREGRVLRANRAALVAARARLEDVLGRLFWETPWWSHDPAQQARVRDAVRRAAAGESVHFEGEHRRSTGDSVYVDFTLSPVRDERGQVVALIPEGHDITERRLAEKALRESEEKLARAFAACPDAITITDLATGLLIDVNTGFERLFEWPRAEAVGRSTLELRLWANEADRGRLIGELQRAGHVRELVAVGRTRAGRLVRCVIAGEVVEIAGASAIILVIRDVTEQVRAEQALRESEERLRLLIEHAPDAIVVLDVTAGTFVEANREAQKFFGVERARLIGRPLADFNPERQPDGRLSCEVARAQLMAAIAGGRPAFEWTHRLPDGRERVCEVRLMRLPSPDAVLVRGSLTDLSERKRADQAFRALLEGTAGVAGQAFFENTVARLARELGVRVAFVAEIDTSRHGLWLRCLARWADGPAGACERDVTGTALEEVVQCPVFCAESGLAARYPGDPFLGELRADSLLAMPVLDRGGSLLGVVAVADDKPMPDSDAARLLVAVSAARAAVEIQHRRADEAIHRLNADLERRVAERTAQLAAANAELESFSYSVSHDLRSPLRAIDGFSRALEEDFGAMLGPEGGEFLARIRAASQRMGLLIDDLLRLSRATRVEMRPEAVDLSALAGTVVAELRQREPDRAVEFTVEPGLMAVVDRALAAILLQNLLDNAWKYTRRVRPAQIRFARAPQAPAAGEGPVFQVSDNGAGFDMRYVGKLFAPFQRLHGPKDFEGTGIGLATVRRIVARHGGRVWIEGAVGQGTTVYFTFGTTPV